VEGESGAKSSQKRRKLLSVSRHRHGFGASTRSSVGSWEAPIVNFTVTKRRAKKKRKEGTVITGTPGSSPAGAKR